VSVGPQGTQPDGEYQPEAEAGQSLKQSSRSTEADGWLPHGRGTFAFEPSSYEFDYQLRNRPRHQFAITKYGRIPLVKTKYVGQI
jgi:hypothetical protein